MRVWIDREACAGDLATCLTCLSQLVRTGTTEHACVVDFEGNGSKDLTIFTLSQGQQQEPMVIPKQLVDMVVYQFREGVLGPKIEIEF